MKKILLIDDQKNVIHIVKRSLEKAGFLVKAAYNGRDGLDILFREGLNIGLIFLDMDMPVLNGTGFIKEFIKFQEYTCIPVFICTGNLDKKAKDELYQFGIADILLKPVDLNVYRSYAERYILREDCAD